MKIQIASDLHLEFMQDRFPDYRAVEPTDADVLVIAGDIHHHASAIEAFRDWHKPVIYVHGNHELYDADHEAMVTELRRSASGTAIRYLDCDSLVLDGVRFLGCCLWTDYLLYDADPLPAMREAENVWFDQRMIRAGDSLFSAGDAARIHRHSRTWLERQLDTPFDGRTVVVTHHAPHAQSIHPRFEGSALNPAFVSDLGALMGKADLWVHGHVHDSVDYRIGKTRVVANPRGYPLNRKDAATLAEINWENPLFNPALVIELP